MDLIKTIVAVGIAMLVAWKWGWIISILPKKETKKQRLSRQWAELTPEEAEARFLAFANQTNPPVATVLGVKSPNGRIQPLTNFTMPGIGRDDIDPKSARLLARTIWIEAIVYDKPSHQEAGILPFSHLAYEMKKWEAECTARAGTGMMPVMTQEMALKNAFFTRLYADRDDIVNRIRHEIGMMPKTRGNRHDTNLVMHVIGQSGDAPPTKAFMCRSETVDGIELSAIKQVVDEKSQPQEPQFSDSMLTEMKGAQNAQKPVGVNVRPPQQRR